MRGKPGIGAFLLLTGGIAVLVFTGRGDGGGGAWDDFADGQSVRAQVVRVIDGDTIEVSIEGHDEDVRYIGMDTPETVKPDTPVQCFGPQASALNHRLVDGRTVRLVFDDERRDVYGRLLAYVHTGGRLVKAVLVRRGFARTLTFPPNTDHVVLFRRLATQAARASRGLWGTC